MIGSVIDGDVVSGAARLPGPRPDLGDGRRLRHVKGLSVIRRVVGDPAHLAVPPDTDGVLLAGESVVIVIQAEVERLEVPIIIHVILHTAHRRGVKSPTRNLIHSDLPESRKTGPCVAHLILLEGSTHEYLPVKVIVIVGLDVRELLKLSM